MKKKIVVGVTGASGAVYAKRLIEKINARPDLIEKCDIVFSRQGSKVWEHETGNFSETLFPNKVWPNDTFFAPFASGSGDFDALIVCPCSMGTLGRIAAGTSNDLISRTADVMLKERRKVVLVIREMPFNLIHINNMKTVTESGGIIMPASPSFYNHPESIDEMIDQTTDKILNITGFTGFVKPWNFG
jgi:4-hydroxy-3-polyprenylbenzoate decarboxylase